MFCSPFATSFERISKLLLWNLWFSWLVRLVCTVLNYFSKCLEFCKKVHILSPGVIWSSLGDNTNYIILDDAQYMVRKEVLFLKVWTVICEAYLDSYYCHCCFDLRSEMYGLMQGSDYTTFVSWDGSNKVHLIPAHIHTPGTVLDCCLDVMICVIRKGDQAWGCQRQTCNSGMSTTAVKCPRNRQIFSIMRQIVPAVNFYCRPHVVGFRYGNATLETALSLKNYRGAPKKPITALQPPVW